MTRTETNKIRNEFAKAMASTRTAIIHLRNLQNAYGLDYSHDDSTIALLQKALRLQVADRDYLIEFVNVMELEA